MGPVGESLCLLLLGLLVLGYWWDRDGHRWLERAGRCVDCGRANDACECGDVE